MTQTEKSDIGNPLPGLIKRLKVQFDLSEEEIARRFGYSRQHLNAVKNGKKPLQTFIVQKIESLLRELQDGIRLKEDSQESLKEDNRGMRVTYLSSVHSPELKRECRNHLEAFLETCDNHQDRLGWTKVTLEETLPLNKWEKKS